jgi:hypothetical protein
MDKIMSNIVLLEEFLDDNRYEICEEKINGEPKLFYRGVIARANFANKNKRVYPFSVMENAVGKLQKPIQERAFVGELDHPPSPKINVEKISHIISSMKLLESGEVVGEIEPLDTEPGKHLKTLMKARIKLGVSTRGSGTVKPYAGPLGEGLVEVNPDFNMAAVDIVWNPSNDAYPQIVTESTNIMIGQTEKFKKVWDELFNK